MKNLALRSHDRAKAFSLSMPNHEYHARPELSNSQNNILIDQSPMHFKYYMEHPRERSKPMIEGEIVHLLVLEPEKFLETAVAMPKVDRRTKEGKDFYEKFHIENEGKLVLDNDTYHMAFGMIGSIMEHPKAREILKSNHNELSFFGEIDGVKVRCRPDILRAGNLIADLKTTENAGFRAFQKSVSDWQYHRQAAFYCDLVGQVTGETYDTFTIIAVEKKAPYAVQVFYLDEATLEKGREEYRHGLAIYKNCMATNFWPGYSNEVIPMNLPSWRF